ncbi:MAG: hypothetical protein AAGA48_09160 [Myxococcota bacterium]
MSDSNPSRRRLLGGLAAAASAPAWVAAAFAAEPPERQMELFSTWHNARRMGVPLLAIVTPTDRTAWERGRVVGAMLAEADDKLMATLQGYAPVCATALDLHLLGVVVPPDAWFAVIGTKQVPARTVPIAGPQVEVTFEGRVGLATRALRKGLAAFTPLYEEPKRRTVLKRAAHDAREVWLRSRLPGSYWANETGCGLHIEEYEDGVSWACGMGSVPARAARFLYFADADLWPW